MTVVNHIDKITKFFGFELNEGQIHSLDIWEKQKNLFLNGPAGTGKTFISLYNSINSILEKEQSDLIIIRNLVPTRNIGFLPGDIVDKQKPYFEVYEGIVYEILSCLIEKNKQSNFFKERIHFVETSFLRGRTWDNSIIYIDEVQNLTKKELHTVMTRIGKNSRVIVSGDIYQTDLDKRNESCFSLLCDAVSELSSFEEIVYYSDDIIRSDFVKEWCEVVEPLLP